MEMRSTTSLGEGAAQTVIRHGVTAITSVVGVVARAAWEVARLALGVVLAMLEPLVAAVLVPVSCLSFFVTLVFGFLMGDPRFPKWGMLLFSIGTYGLYLAFLFLLLVVMGGGRGRY